MEEEDVNLQQIPVPKKTLRSLNVQPKQKLFREYTQASNNKTFYNTGFGESKYDKNLNWDAEVNVDDVQGSINEHRAQNQGWGVKAAAGLGRIGTKILAETAKLPGVVGGIVAAPFAEEGKGWETAFNNPWIKAVNNLNEEVNQDLLPVYVKKAVKEGNLWDNLSSIDFWATEGADGVGFMASMFVPGALVKGLGLGTKFAKIAGGFKLGREAGITAKAIDEIAITTANTISEAGSEAGSAMDSYKTDLEDKHSKGLITDVAYNEGLQQVGRIGRDSFLLNAALLGVTNHINTKMLNLAGDGAVAKAGNYSLRNAEGKLLSEVPARTFRENLLNQGKKLTTSTFSEGFVEEGLQSTIENDIKRRASKGELSDSFFTDAVSGDFSGEYLDMLTTTDGQKAIALGGLLGHGAYIASDIKSIVKTGKTEDGHERTRVNNLLSKGKEITNTYFAQTNPDIYKKTEELDENGDNKYELVNGKKVIDPVKRNEYIKNAKITEEEGALWDYAKETDNKDILEELQNKAENRLIAPFITESKDGLNVLGEYLKENPTLPEDTRKRILKKAEALQKTNEQFLNYASPVLGLKNDNAIHSDAKDFFNMLQLSHFHNTSAKLNSEAKLDSSVEETNNLLEQHGLEKDSRDNGNLMNSLPQKDMRFGRVLESEAKHKRILNNLKQDNVDLWNPKKQQEAFDEFVKERKETRDRNSEENIAAADKLMDNINNAKSVTEIENAVKGITPESIEADFNKENSTEPVVQKSKKNEVSPIDTVDSVTKEVIKVKAEQKKAEIITAQKEEIENGNTEILDEIVNNNKDILNSVRNLENVIINGDEYSFVDAGEEVYVMMSSEMSEVFDSQNALIARIEELLNINKIEDIAVEKPSDKFDFEQTEVVHLDQIESQMKLIEEDVKNEPKDVSYPTIEILGFSRAGEFFDKYLPVTFKNWLNNFTNKIGTPVTFSMPEKSRFGYDLKQIKAVELLESKDFSDLDFLYRHLPLQVNISKDNFTFIPTLTDKVEESSLRYVARKNIVQAILDNNGYEGVTSKINYQKGGKLNYIKPENDSKLLENNISNLQQFDNDYTKVPLYFVKDEQGNIYDETGNISQEIPSTLTHSQKGYVYTIIKSHNENKVPVKLNVNKLNIDKATLVYEMYKSLYEYNKNSTNKLNQYNAKLEILFENNQQLKDLVESNFQKELNIFKNKSRITVADFMTLFVHDNVTHDGDSTRYTTKFGGASINFGENSFLNFGKETEEFKNALIDFLVNQKRQNIKLDFLAGVNQNIDSTKYKNYLINEKVLNVNLDTNQPFTGDINIMIDSKVNSTISNKKLLEEKVPNTLISQNKEVLSQKPVGLKFKLSRPISTELKEGLNKQC